MNYIDELHDLCKTIEREISEANEKISKAGGKLTAGDVDYIDKLTHTLKSIKAVIAMMDGDDDEYSSRGSYARGRNTRRDSMGRYSSDYRYDRGSYVNDGYSRDGYSRDGFADKLRDLMHEAPNEHIKTEIGRLADKVMM